MSKVCLCRGITEEQIIEAVKNGATSFEEVKEETGAVVQIPFHVLEGETIRVNTETGEYIEKVK